MRIEDEIVEWAKTRPNWQRAVLRRIASGETINDREWSSIADRLASQGWEAPEEFSTEHLPGRTSVAKAVTFVSIGDVEHCNALAEGHTLEFGAKGITVVYGNNGTGKSGYARLIKTIVRARHRQAVLTDIFRDEPSVLQLAKVVIELGGERAEFHWPDATHPELAQVGFYDDACGDAFIARESEVTYRPPALFVMDELIRVCDAVRSELDERLKRNQEQAESLPEFPDGTVAAEFVMKLSAATTADAIATACGAIADLEGQLEAATREEQRLASINPSKEKQRLREDAARLRRIAARLVECDRYLGDGLVMKLRTLHEGMAVNAAAVALASNKSFDREPLRGVGAPVWRAMWEAARRYAESDAYAAQRFPFTGPEARCVLCQTELDARAADRLERFGAFVRNDAQQKLDAVSERWAAATRELERFEPMDLDVRLSVEQLSTEHAAVGAACRRTLVEFEGRKSDLLAVCGADGEWQDAIRPAPVPPSELVELAQKLEAESSLIDDSTFAEKARQASMKRINLQATKRLSECRGGVEREVKRLQARERLENAKRQTATTGISKRASELTREHMTAVMRDRFTRESDRLRLERVTLEDRGAAKGTLHHRPAFVGAVQEAALSQVLSEGEQTALGLAGFFTEVYLDESRSAIVLDDPVTSLDHRRRERVAERLIAFAMERQVIVFTHDVSFVVDLRAAAAREKVSFTERAIERMGAGKPGACRTVHPWKARDARGRLESLRAELDEIRSQQQEWDEETYERNSAGWAGRLSETWEQLIKQEVVGQVVDYGSLEVRPKLFRILSRITEQDEIEFQASYGRVSRWAPRHDKSAELNYIAPTTDEMAEELARAKAWFKRVKGYRE